MINITIQSEFFSEMYISLEQGSQLALCRAEIAHLISNLICCLFETFR